MLLLWTAAAFAASLTVRAPAFSNGASIPVEHTCSGEDASPQLVWAGAPANTVSYAVVVDDVDGRNDTGGPWVHWIVFNVPATTPQLNGNVLINETHFLQGVNDFKLCGGRGCRDGPNTAYAAGIPAWSGPCPPPGKGPHRYNFRVYALDTSLALPAGASRAEVDAAMKGHILAQGVLMGRFER